MSGTKHLSTSAGRRSRVALAVSGVVLALLVPLAPARAATPTIVISRGSVIGGESISVTGKIGQRKARTVVLQRQSGRTWVKVVVSRTTAAGAYKFLYKPPTKAGSRTVVRVVAPKVKIGRKTYRQITSGGRSVLTVAQTAAVNAPDFVNQGTAFSLTGTFKPARPGRTVLAQKRLASGTWVGIGQQGVESSTGTVRLTTTTTTTTQFRLLALAAGGAPAFASPATTVGANVASPTGLTTQAVDSTTVRLSWTGTPSASGYRVYKRDEGSPQALQVSCTAITATSCTVGDLHPDTTYYFSVSAVSGSEESTLSPEVSVRTTPDDTGPPPVDTTPPPVPTEVSAAPGSSSARVTWAASPAGDLQGYFVYRSTDAGGSWTRLTTTSISDTSYTSTGLTNGTPYYFAVSSVDTSGNESARSAAAAVTPADGPVGWSAVSAGRRHTCAIGSNGSLYCWGVNNYGQLGNPSGVETGNAYTTPVRVGSSTGWTDVAAGDDFTCGIQAPGTLWCWGLDTYGQLGNGTASTSASPLPSQVGSGTTWASVSAGAHHACALTTAGAISCWGLNTDGQLGRSTGLNTLDPNPTAAPAGSASDWAEVSAGKDHTCATKTNHTLYCWGSNLFGQLGIAAASGTATPTATPTQVGTGNRWTTVSAGDYGTCGILTAGLLGLPPGGMQCWGRNQYGQLAAAVDTKDGAHPTPTTVSGGDVWAQVSVGGGQVCAVRKDKTAWCWGRNNFGQAGSAASTPLTTPTKVGTAASWVALEAGNGIDDSAGHTAALTGTGAIFTWGANLYGQLGRSGGNPSTVGTTNASPTPGEVPAPS